MAGNDDMSVRVAVRIRPQNAQEKIDMCSKCTFCTPGNPQVFLGKDKAFTFDHVFGEDSPQTEIYKVCTEKLIEGCFEGYNATVFAYGQTGSGKTYTMGSGFEVECNPETTGIIPRAVAYLFNGIDERRRKAVEERRTPPTFEVHAQFLELYHEQIRDLFDHTQRMDSKGLHIHEDAFGNIYLKGATMKKITSEEETLANLHRGALNRTVGSTNMNAQSSRSHAIFTLHVKQERVLQTDESAPSSETGERDATVTSSPREEGDMEILSAKFHFVDLAGSERLKRTGATGERAKEGISINCGLLALGNVISALGDKYKRGGHVPYRDSKLTRLLQDSLGGNSRTLMIACISPSDRDFMETLNTLMYANRAKNIKNKVVVNQDQASQQLGALRNRVRELELELAEYRSGRLMVTEEGSTLCNDTAAENTMLRADNDKLRMRLKALQQVIDSQNARLAELQFRGASAAKVTEDTSTGQLIAPQDNEEGVGSMVHGYLKQIEELKSQLVLSESLARQSPRSPYRRAPSAFVPYSAGAGSLPAAHLSFEEETIDDVLKAAKVDIAKMNKHLHKTKRKSSSSTPLKSPKASPQRSSSSPGHLTSSSTADEEEEEQDEEDSHSDSKEEEEEGKESDVDDSGPDSNSEDETESSEGDSDEAGSIQDNLATLSSEISIKQKLVEQLEGAQKSMHSMRQQYESKLLTLQQRISRTESERDRVLQELATCGTKLEDKAKEVKDQYSTQLDKLQKELKQLKAAKKEHQRALKQQASTDRELKTLKKDLDDMKKQRVKLMHKMRDEATRNRQEEARTMKAIAQLKKDSRKKDNIIKSLEIEQKRKEVVLKRKQEEVVSLRKVKLVTQPALSRPPSVSTGGVVMREGNRASKTAHMINRRKSSIFSSESARVRWRNMERKVRDIISWRQTVAGMEEELDRYFKRREELHRKMEETVAALAATEDQDGDEAYIQSLQEEQELLEANLEYVGQMITDQQSEIVCMMEGKGDGDTVEASSIIHNSSVRDAKYLLEHFLDMAINFGLKAEQKTEEVKDLNVQKKQMQSQMNLVTAMSRGRLTHVTHSSVASDSEPERPKLPPKPTLPPAKVKDSKYRRRTALPHELKAAGEVRREPNLAKSSCSALQEAWVAPSPGEGTQDSSNSQEMSDSVGFSSPVPTPGTPPPLEPPVDSRTVVKKRKGSKNADCCLTSGGGGDGSGGDSISTQASKPPSPNRTQSKFESNVFARLTSNIAQTDSSGGDSQYKGHFRRSDSRTRNAGGPLTCSHTAQSHKGEVLSVCATDSLLFSASKDRTVKIWDLSTMTEMAQLSNHASYVRKVAFCEKSGCVFSASQTTVKLWDIRESNKLLRCLSQGRVDPDPSPIQDMIATDDGKYLFTSAGTGVLVWDLRKTACVGRLAGHSGAVQSLVLGPDVMITGSRDRLIKIYPYSTILESLGDTEATCIPIQTLLPLHYDAVSAMALWDNTLFSACGVTIKLWGMDTCRINQSIDGAQANTITSLAWLPWVHTLVSGDRGGEVKVWTAGMEERIRLNGTVTASKQAVNAMAANSSCLFTGQADRKIKIWRVSL